MVYVHVFYFLSINQNQSIIQTSLNEADLMINDIL